MLAAEVDYLWAAWIAQHLADVAAVHSGQIGYYLWTVVNGEEAAGMTSS